MSARLSILSILATLLVGCRSLPPMDSTRLIERMTSAYASCQSFEDLGTIREVETDAGETNATVTSFRIQFLRGQAYRMQVDADRTHGVGPYSLVYHWDGRSWSSYDSINLYYGWQPVKTNVDKDALIGTGVALSFGLFPSVPRLLHLEDGDFSGFRLYDSAEVATDRLHGRPVYRLTLRWEFWGDHDTDEYWIAPDTFTILQRCEREIKNRGDRIDTLTRTSTHSPRLDSLPRDARIEFSPPKSRANKGAAANRRPAGQADGSGSLTATVATDRAFPAAVAELDRSLNTP